MYIDILEKIERPLEKFKRPFLNLSDSPSWTWATTHCHNTTWGVILSSSKP